MAPATSSLPVAAFPLNEDGGIAVCCGPDCLENILHDTAFADQVAELMDFQQFLAGFLHFLARQGQFGQIGNGFHYPDGVSGFILDQPGILMTDTKWPSLCTNWHSMGSTVPF